MPPPIPVSETLESIIAWGEEIFGPCTIERAVERAGEEWSELIEPGADIPVEAADVVICLMRIPGIQSAINRKMKINRKRQWNLRGDGTGYHVKPAPELGEPVEIGGHDIDRSGPLPFKF